MANPHAIGPDRNSSDSGPYGFSQDAEHWRALVTAVVLVLLILGGVALLMYSNENARVTTLTDITTGQSTRPAPSQPFIPFYQHP